MDEKLEVILTREQRALLVGASLLFLTTVFASAQIQVEGGLGANLFKNTTSFSLSEDITNPGDLFLQNDLELGGELYLDGAIYMNRDATNPADVDQLIYFAGSGDQDLRKFGWDVVFQAFRLEGPLRLIGPVVSFIPDLNLHAIGTRMRFVVDSDANQDAGTSPHLFTWFNNNNELGSRAMELRSTGPSPNLGNLTIAGSLTQNGFDLAEMFLAASELRPGEVVAVDASRPDAVRPAVAGDRGRMLGVVATEPGVILGGGAFSIDALRRQWGVEIADEFERERPALETAAYAENPWLRERADLLVSPHAFAEDFQRRSGGGTVVAETRDEADSQPIGRPRPPLKDPALEEAYTQALVQHEADLFDASLDVFFERRFARVALAGRVPIRVDASYGSIEAGDALTASPVPGFAMKAQEPGWIIGTALEALASGSGTILAFVDRGWFGGE